MSDVFISYARDEAATAEQVVAALRALGYEVWRDDQIPPHRDYSEVLAERIDAAKAVLVLWSPKAAKSQWVRSEADRARAQGKLVQAMIAPARLPMPFDQIQCEDLAGWLGDGVAPAWKKLVASLAEMSGRAPAEPVAARPAASSSAGGPPTVAVPPFARGEDDAERLIAEGVADELVTALSRFPQLKVIGGEGARHPGARFVLEGVVRRAAAQVRISIKLTDTGDDTQIWAERFDGAAEDAFGLQDRAAAAAAAGVMNAVDAAETRRVLALPPGQLSAYELFLRAVHLERVFTREALQEGTALLELAIARDPNFGPALAFAALTNSLMVMNGWADDADAITRKSLELARRALATARLDADSLSTVATVFIWVGEDPAGCDAMVARAMAQNPGAPLPWFASGWVRLFGGEPALATESFERHMAIDPRSTLQAFVAGGIGTALMLEHRFDEAAPRLREALRAVPDQRMFRAALIACLAFLGRREEAGAMFAELPEQARKNFLGLFRREADRALMREGLRLAAPRGPRQPRPGVRYGRRR
jgi:TolB-like protein